MLTAFYTPKEITDTIADVLADYSVRPARMLEPSAGCLLYTSLYRDLYLFCAFTGLSFADMRNLTEENIRTYFDEHEWININRQKTDVYKRQ